MREEVIQLFTFEELSEEAQQKALESLAYINVDHDWWDFIYEEAKEIGLKITSFDLDRCLYCKGEFIEDAYSTAYEIKKSHGENCETYKTAVKFLSDRDKIVEEAPKDEFNEYENESELDEKLDEVESEFLNSILEDYRIILTKEYEYLTSKEVIIETINSNEWEFLASGKRYLQ